jgi:hypothetical protein
MSNKNFIVKNGIEVDGDLIFADPDTNKVGIKTSTPTVELDVSGDIRANNLMLSDSLSINGNIEINGQLGDVGSFISVTGAGITWSPIPGMRTLASFVSSPGQVQFIVNYNISTGVDVFINGTRLTSDDYVATSGTDIEVLIPLFGGEKVDIIAYSVFGTASPGITIQENSTPIGTQNAINKINFVGFSSIVLSQDGFGVNVINALGDIYDIEVKNQIRFYEDQIQCPNYISFEAPSSLTTTTSYQYPSNYPPGNNYNLTSSPVGIMTWKRKTDSTIIPLTGDDEVLKVGTLLTIPYWPENSVLTSVPVWMLNTPATGANGIFDIRISNTTIFAIPPSIDISENNSSTAVTPSAFSTAFNNSGRLISIGSSVTFQCTQMGSNYFGAGLKIVLFSEGA